MTSTVRRITSTTKLNNARMNVSNARVSSRFIRYPSLRLQGSQAGYFQKSFLPDLCLFYVEIEKPAIRDRKHDHQFCNQRLIVILTQSFWELQQKAARRSYRAAEEDTRCCAQNRRFLQNVDVLTGQRLVHAAHGTELAAHAAGVAVVVLRQAGIADGLGGLRVQCAGELCIPVQHAAGIAHLIVDVPGVGDALGDIGGVGSDLGGHDALLHIVHIGQSQMLGGGSHSTGKLHRWRQPRRRRWQR